MRWKFGIILAAGISLTTQMSWSTTVPQFSVSSGIEHPLVGTIVAPSDSTSLSPQQLIKALLHSDIILLGENHFHPDHHILQAWVLQEMIQAGRRPGLAFEMIYENQQSILEEYQQLGNPNTASLGEALAWETRGWPPWVQYQPLADLAVGHGLPIIAADLSMNLTKNIQQFGLFAIPGARRTKLGLHTPMPMDLFTTMKQDMERVHCQKTSDRLLDTMVLIQHTRDAAMAEHVTQSLSRPDNDSVTLIAGYWHTRTDYGIPAHTKRTTPNATVHSLAFIEVENQKYKPSMYGTQFGMETLPFDFVWFTTRANNKEVCEKTSMDPGQKGH